MVKQLTLQTQKWITVEKNKLVFVRFKYFNFLIAICMN